MKNELISVIIPVFNAEEYLRETVQSVLNQTYSNFELIAVNDGSTDRSLEILQQITDDRIRIIDKENTGVSDTRNVAIKAARGEYICFLDADDYYAPSYLQRMYEIAADKNADMVVCNYVPFRGEPIFKEAKTEELYVGNSRMLVQAGVLTSACTKLIKISTLYKYNILFDTSMSFGEDLFFCWKAYLAAQNVWMIDEKLYGYRMTSTGATSKYHPNLYEKYKAAFVELKEFGKKVHKDDEYQMDVFFATRIPSFILMTVREKSSFGKKYNRLLMILNDDIIQNVYEKWDIFIKKIKPEEIKFYEKCRQKKIAILLLSGYKRNIISALKNKIKGML